MPELFNNRFNQNKSSYFDSIDAFRAIGVIFVFLHHAVNIFGFSKDTIIAPYLYFITALMWSGVNLFFLASGFINGKNFFSDNSKVSFIRKRAKRIFPLYYIYLILGTFFFLQGWDFFSVDGMNIIDHYLFLTGIDFYNQNLGHSLYFCITWSLSVEIQLYLLTLVLMLTKPNQIILLAVSLTIIGIAYPYFANPNHFGLIMHLDEYFIGIIIRFYYDNRVLSKINSKIISSLGIITVICLIPFSNLNQGNPFLDSILLIFYLSILILLLNLKIQYYSKFLTIGKNCYFIYLFHMLFLYIFCRVFPSYFNSNIFILTLSFFACIYASILSNVYLESLFRRSRF